jgi:hypothetical protein
MLLSIIFCEGRPGDVELYFHFWAAPAGTLLKLKKKTMLK